MKTNRFSEFIDTLKFSVEAFLFDLDGVLLNSEIVYQQYWEKVALEFGKDPLVFPFQIKGADTDSIVSNYIPANDRTRIKQGFLDLQLHMQYDLFDGVLEFIQESQKRNIRTAIVTSSDKAKLEVVYSQHPIFYKIIDVVVTADDIQNKKPAPDCWIKASEKLGVNIKHCVIFEDSTNGQKSALASGGYVVGLTTTHHIDEIKPLCHYIIGGLADLI